MEERRRPQPHPDAQDYLHYLRELPSLTLLDRLPIAMLGVGQRGEIAYVNLAFAQMLGYADAETATRLELPKLLNRHEHLTPDQCVHILRTTTSVVEWNHDHGYVLRTVMSPPLLMRATDSPLLLGVNDVTDWHWDTDNRA